MTLELAKAWLQSTESYKAFDKARRESVRAALLAAVKDAFEIDPTNPNDRPGVGPVEITDRHLDAVASAGLPVMKILKLVGASQLMKLAAIWQAPEEKK